MIKILKNGRSLGKLYIVCNKCGCEFECDESDLDSIETWRGYVMAYYVRCPCCRTECKFGYYKYEREKKNENNKEWKKS